MTATDAKLLVNAWTDQAQKCADEIGRAMDFDKAPSRWEIEKLGATRDALRNCATDLQLMLTSKDETACERLLKSWCVDCAWHKKRAEDYRNRCGGAPQWIAEAAADMLSLCARELAEAVEKDAQAQNDGTERRHD